MDGLFISVESFNSLSPSARAEIEALYGLTSGAVMTAAPKRTPGDLHEGPVEIPPALVRALVDRLNPKTMTALRVIAESEDGRFLLSDVIEAVDDAETYMDVKGVWSGLTQRTRNILQDKKADLIWWEGDWLYDEGKDEKADHVGRVAPMTYQSLRKHFGME
ncbi:hypothetical protein [Roseivivax marinus]|uniref:hypothetical protein n=1 Tax=Roseivivax marinus TaxID=1379903 RepID=UPI00273D2AE8|nr:hypothetical protein [Roseivivax marinus]